MVDDQLDAKVREVLIRSLPSWRSPSEDDPVGAVHRRVVRRRQRRQRRRAVVGLATVGLAALATSALVINQADESRTRDLSVAAPASTEVPTTAGIGGPPSTLDTPIVVEPDGVQSLPDAPLNVQQEAAVVWTGAELVVWGGDVEPAVGLSGSDCTYCDGAAFSPATATWRALSASPLPSSLETPVAVMTDAGVLIARGTATALWQPGDDTWLTLPGAPRPVYDLTGAGDVAISHSANALLDLPTGEWRNLPPPPLRLERSTTAWTGEELVVLGGPNTPFTRAAAIAYEPANDTWREIAPPPRELSAEALSADWDGRRVVVVNYDMTAAAYDPAKDSWQQLPSVPARFYEHVPSLRSVGGRSLAFMASAIAVLNEKDRWVPLPYGDIPSGQFVATDTTLFSWSAGREAEGDRLTAVDPVRLVEGTSRVQVGIGSVDLTVGGSVVDATYGSPGGPGEVKVSLEYPGGGRCTVSSAYGRGLSGLPIEETLASDGGSISWRRNETGTTWETTATSSDVLTVTCGTADAARALASSVNLDP